MSKLPLTLIALPFATAALAMPAAAQEKQTAIVRYDDLNLSTAKDRDRLTRRVSAAIRDVCETAPRYRQTLAERSSALKCAAIAQRDADVKLASVLKGDATAFASRGQVAVAAP